RATETRARRISILIARNREAVTGSILRRPNAAQLLHCPALYLLFHTLLFCRAAWPRRHTEFRLMRRLGDHLDEPVNGVAPVCLLRAKAVRRDDDDAVFRELRPCNPLQPRAHPLRQGRGAPRIKAKLRRTRHLVDVLPARPARANESDGDFILINAEPVSDGDHWSFRVLIVTCIRLPIGKLVIRKTKFPLCTSIL